MVTPVKSSSSEVRRSPRQRSTKKGNHDGGIDVVDKAVGGRSTNRRSISSPPYRARSSDRDSESQSEADVDNADTEEVYATPDQNSSKIIKRFQDKSPPSPLQPTVVVESATRHISFFHSHWISTSNEGHIGQNIVLLMIMVTVIVVVGLACTFGSNLFNYTKKPVAPKTLGDIEDDIVRDLDKLRSETKQDKRFWGEVYSGLSLLTDEHPRQPAVLMLAVPDNAQRTAVCLAHHLTDIVSKAFEDSHPPVLHDTRDHLALSPEVHKQVLDDQLQLLRDSRAAVVYNLELMPADTVTLLHGYCDNDNAPFKRSVLLLLLELGVPASSVSQSQLDLTVERRLHQLWRPYMPADHIPGLVSRVSGQTLLVLPETRTVLDDLCPH